MRCSLVFSNYGVIEILTTLLPYHRCEQCVWVRFFEIDAGGPAGAGLGVMSVDNHATNHGKSADVIFGLARGWFIKVFRFPSFACGKNRLRSTACHQRTTPLVPLALLDLPNRGRRVAYGSAVSGIFSITQIAGSSVAQRALQCPVLFRAGDRTCALQGYYNVLFGVDADTLAENSRGAV